MGRRKKEKTREELQAEFERHRQSSREYQANLSRAGREIGVREEDAGDVKNGGGDLPAVVNVERKGACREDFLRFCREYHGEDIFTKPFSASQLRVARIMEHAALHGGSYAWCQSRGGAKTTFCEVFLEWALLYGHVKFAILAAASKEAAWDSYQAVKARLEENDLLLEDFPEVCYPVRQLEGKPQRAPGMLLNGESIKFEWTEKQLIFPRVPGSVCAGSIFRAMGYDGRLRGQKYGNRRPDCVILDDIQKDRNARNPANVRHQLDILKRVIKGMKSRDGKLTVLVPGTRLNATCFMSQVTDRKANPAYQGSIFRAVETLPKNMELWQEYRKRWIERANELWAVDPSDKGAWRSAMMAATEFYRQNRQAMDAGAVVDWPEMFEEDEISGIQNMMNIYLENEATFWTEYQNDPQQNVQELAITEPGLAEKVLPDVPRGVVPAGTECLTLGADVQGELLYWIVTAWRDGFAGHIVAYGTVPTQPAIVFKAANAPLPLSQLYPVQNKEGQHEIALNTLIEEVMNHEWTTESGSTMTIDRGLIDANWDVSADTIHTVINRHYRFFLKNGRYGAYPLLPARGRGTTRGGLFYESKKQMESQTQFSYLTPPRTKEELVGTVWVNTNKIKSFVGHRLLAPVGAPGSLTIHDAPPGQHTLLFDHLTAEFATAATLGNLSYDKWVLKPTRTENHWWDALCLSAIANAMQGARLTVHDAPPKRIRYTFDPNGVG